MRIFLFILLWGTLCLACQTGQSQGEASRSPAATSPAPTKVVIWGSNSSLPMAGIEYTYVDLLPNMLAGDGIRVDVVPWGRKDLMLGHSDPRLNGMRDSIIAQRPDWVMMAFGLEEGWQMDISAESFGEELQTQLQAFEAAGIKVLLITPAPPAPDSPELIFERLEAMNQEIRRVSIENHGTVVDFWNFAQIYAAQSGNRPEDLLLDQRYPNEAAQQFLAQEITALLGYKIMSEP